MKEIKGERYEVILEGREGERREREVSGEAWFTLIIPADRSRMTYGSRLAWAMTSYLNKTKTKKRRFHYSFLNDNDYF